MPEVTPNTPPNPATNNDEVVKKLGEQDLTPKPASSQELQESGDALDALLKAAQDEKPAVEETPVVEPAKPTEKPAAAAPPVEPTAPVVPAEDPHKAKAEELFKDSPSLPPGASLKSSEAFATIKIKAAQEVSAREQKIEELTKKLADAEQKLKNPVPDEITQELKGLREFRSKLDVEADPKFKEFDAQIAKTREFIYSQLIKSPAVDQSVIDLIKKHGGPEFVKLDKLFEAINDPDMRRIVDNAMTNIEQLKFNKNEAIKSAKDNIDHYLTERQKANDQAVTEHNDKTKTYLDTLTGQLEWLKPVTPDAKADEAAKKAAASHNEFVKDIGKKMQDSLSDDSPEMRAIMITATAQLLYLQRVFEGVKGENVSLKKQVEELTAKLDKFKAASTSRLRESAAPPGTPTFNPAKVDDVNVRTGDALDAAMKQVMEERNRAAGTR